MKKLILALLLIATPVYAQFFEINDFSALQNSQVSPYLVPKGGAVEAKNLRANKQVGSLSKREGMLLYGNCRSSAVKGLYRFYKTDATQHLLVASSTFLDRGDDDGGSCLELKSGFTDGKRWQFVTYKDLAIGVNGSDMPVKYDGSTDNTDNTDGNRTAGDLATELGAPFAELNTGANLDASSWYQYKIAFYDGTNYSYSEARSNPILTGSSVQDINLTDIPLGVTGTTQRIIYRTVGNASKTAVEADTNYYRVATISDNSTRVYADAINDATILGDSAPTWSTVSGGTEVSPPKGKLIEIHKDRIFIGNDSSQTFGKSSLYWSDVLNPDFWDTGTNVELIRPDDGDELTCIKNQLSLLTLCKNNTIQKFFTDTSSSSSWEISAPFSFVGTGSHYSVANSPLGIIYLSQKGLYTFNGATSTLISDKVTDVINDISTTSIAGVAGVYFNNEYQLAYTSKSTGSGTNDRVLVLDTVRNAYEVDDKNIDVFAVLNSGSDFGTLYSGSSTTDGKIFAHSSSPDLYIVRKKSEFEAGTRDTIEYLGTENSPILEIGWGVTIDTTTLAGVTIDSATYSTAIIDRPDTTGIWFSPITQINANNLAKLFWNEELGVNGDITFAVKSGSSTSDVISASYSSEFTNPSGSDLSGLTADNWIQVRSTLTTTDITTTPQLITEDNFTIKLSYTTEGTAGETVISTIWETGWMNFGGQLGNFPKRIKEYQIFYEGTSGTITLNTKNSLGIVDRDFTFDLSVAPTVSAEDEYFGTTDNKMFRHIPPIDDESDPLPIGRYFKFKITEDGVEEWKINRIVIVYEPLEYITFPTDI